MTAPKLPDLYTDIDLMRDVYMTRAQREAYERILARAAVEASQPTIEVTDEMVRERWPWVGRVLLPSYRERLRAELSSGQPAPKADALRPTGDNAEHVRVLEAVLSGDGWENVSADALTAALAAAIAALSASKAEAKEIGYE